MECPTNCRVAFRAQVLDHIVMGFKLLLFLFLIYSHHSQAVIVENSVVIGGASNAILKGATQWEVYGAFIGPDEGFNQETPFNNCTVELDPMSDRFIGCNPRRVNASTALTISFIDDIQFAGQRQVVIYNKAGLTAGEAPVEPILFGNYAQGSTFVGRATWGELCDAAGGTMGNYNDASILVPSLSPNNDGVSVCLDEDGVTPLNASVQFAAGVRGDNGLATTEILLTIKFYSPSRFLGSFWPANIPPSGSSPLATQIEGADGFLGIPGKSGVELTGLSGATLISNTSAIPDPFPAATGDGETYQGFVDYQIRPGDDKIRMESRADIANTLDYYDNNINANGLTVPISGFILYLSNSDFQDTQPWNAQGSVSALLNSPGNVSSGFDDNSFSSPVIKNDVPVFARMGTIDQSGSITHLFSQAMIDANCTDPPPLPSDGTYYTYFIQQPSDANETTQESGGCPYATIPSLITGILKDDINCFVATALKGSPYDYQVLALREFRNRFLNSFSLGRSFVDFYYSKGPQAAKWLNENPKYKPFFRILLWPAYLVAVFFNFLGGVFSLVLISSLIAVFVIRKVYTNLPVRDFRP